MKILIVHNAYQSHHIGGEDIVVHQEIKGLQKILGNGNVFVYLVSNDNLRLGKLAYTIWGDKYHYQQIEEKVKKHQIDIVHVHNFFPLLTPSVFIAAKKSGAKVVHTVHNFRENCLSGIFYRKDIGHCEQCMGKKFGWPSVVHGCYRDSKLQSLCGSLAFAWYHYKQYQKNIDAYFILSPFAREKLKNILPESKMLLKPNGIDPPLQLPECAIKKDYLFVGRLESAKGIDLLLSTWKKLPSSFRLNIIGTGENFASLQQNFACENITFLGKLSHDVVLDWMRKVKFLVHTSLSYETFGLTMVEALASGTPVIGIACGSRLDFIQSAHNGFLCEAEHLLETLLKSYYVTNYEQLSQNAFESAKKFYYKEVLARQIALYQQILMR